jgi:hypothetical protein
MEQDWRKMNKILNRSNYMEQYFRRIKQFIASPEGGANEEKQDTITSSETVEQQCPILNDAKMERILEKDSMLQNCMSKQRFGQRSRENLFPPYLKNKTR